MKLLAPITIGFSTAVSAASYLSPKLPNLHQKLTESAQVSLLAPFHKFLDLATGCQPQQGLSDTFECDKSIKSSHAFVSGEQSVSFFATLGNGVDLHGYLDFDTLNVRDVTIKPSSDSDKTALQKSLHMYATAGQPADLTSFYQHKNTEAEYKNYLQTYGLSAEARALDGGNPEFFNRFIIFSQNIIRTAWMNALERGTAEYGTTKFSDLAPQEFDQFYKLPKSSISKHLRTKVRNFQLSSISSTFTDSHPAPTEHDWRQKGAVTPVKNQGMCGSCWTFSTTGNIEGVHAVATGDLISLSEQELVDCDKTDSGCNGGLMDNAFEAIEDLGGLETEADYGYKGKRETCEFSKDKVAVTISGYHDVPVGDETAMRDQLLETGPLAVALNAMWMQFYRGGVSHPWKRLCSPKMLDHGVLIVGYGVEPANPDHVPFPKKEQPFWTIKNSWGESWGEAGYYRLYRGDGTCGIDQYVTTAEA